jgi:tetratricopeptide (TPR) repeat protein
LREQYRWAVDHFAKTFYRDWNTESLHYELRWLDGDILAPCPDELMHDRKIPRNQITEEIARRVVYKRGNVDPGESLADEMTRHAEKLLRQGRYREAAAVFEFGIQQRPENASVRNNLGFCLIPVEPREALSHLRSAANMGYEPSATNAYNQMCCYVAVGRSRAALNIADSEYKKPEGKQTGAFLWRSHEGQWDLFETESSFKEIAVFAAEIARTEGWKDQEDFWKATIERAELTAKHETDHPAQPQESQESGS